MDWQATWVRSERLTELLMTHPKGDFGEFGLAIFYSREYPTCSNHGAMAKVSADRNWWRCLVCHIGCEWVKERSS